MKTKTISLSLVTLSLLTQAISVSASESRPDVNPYLHDSFNPISHENPAQTDAVDIVSGTKGRTLGKGDAKVLYTDIEASHHILKNIGDKQVAYFSGAGTSISKVDVTGENFKLIHRTMLPGLEKLEKNLTPGIKALLKKVDAAQAALDEKAMHAPRTRPRPGISTSTTKISMASRSSTPVSMIAST
jgi:hypothetical protein